MAEERNPLVDPGFLDAVRSTKGRERTVEFVTALGMVVYSTPRGKEMRCSLLAWRRWARGGEVLRAGNNPFHSTQALGLDHETAREANALINRLADGKINRGEALGALVEYALSHLYQGPGGPVAKYDALRQCLERYQKRITLGNRVSKGPRYGCKVV